MHPHPSSELSDRKQGRLGNQRRKSVPRSISRIYLSKNKFPIYAYADQLNIFTSYRLTGWYAFVIGGQIFDKDGVDYLGVMAKSFWHNHLIFSIPYNYVVRKIPRPPYTLILAVHVAFCLTSFLEISVRQLCFKFKCLVTSERLKIIPYFEWRRSNRWNDSGPMKGHTKSYKRDFQYFVISQKTQSSLTPLIPTVTQQ